tara:strand:- start:1228 stop:1659 length:432 start_codon:yes stop_codon:yes gene_type:complete
MGADPFNRYGVGVNNVGSYQVAGIPWITGSTSLAKGQETKYAFQKITKNITVINQSAADIRIHFASTGTIHPSTVLTGSHYLTLENKGDSYTFNTKASQIFISAPHGNGSSNASYTVLAETTLIDVPLTWHLTGSGITTVDGT